MTVLSSIEDRSARNVVLAALAVMVGMGLIQLVLALTITDSSAWVTGYDVYRIIAMFAGAVLAFLVFRGFKWGESHKLIWGGLAVGFLLWWVAEMWYSSFEIFQATDAPFPNFADVLWLTSYVFLIAAMVIRVRTLRRTPNRTVMAAAVGVFAIVVILCAVFVFAPILGYADYGFLEKTVSVVYPVGDLLLALMGLLVMVVMMGGRLSLTWFFIGLGMMLVGVADLLWTYALWAEIYTSTGTNFVSATANILYIFSYLLMPLGVYLQARVEEAI